MIVSCQQCAILLAGLAAKQFDFGCKREFLITCIKTLSAGSMNRFWGRPASEVLLGLPRPGLLVAQLVKNLPAVQETQVPSLGGEDALKRKWQPTPVFLPGKSHGQRSLVGYSPWSCKESDITEPLNHRPKGKNPWCRSNLKNYKHLHTTVKWCQQQCWIS